MNIEVSIKTFNKLFNSDNLVNTEILEHAEKHHYFNSELDQSGTIIHNFVSNVAQYYLTDINA